MVGGREVLCACIRCCDAICVLHIASINAMLQVYGISDKNSPRFVQNVSCSFACVVHEFRKMDYRKLLLAYTLESTVFSLD